jgi:hypothetical protein
MSANKFLYALEALAHPLPGSQPGGSSGGMGSGADQHSRLQPGGSSWRPTASHTWVLGLAEDQPQPTTLQLQAEVRRLRSAGALLLVCDDDFVHQPRLLEVLMAGREALLQQQAGQQRIEQKRQQQVGEQQRARMGQHLGFGGGGGGIGASAGEVAVGTRGYRVRPDFEWGVLPSEL